MDSALEARKKTPLLPHALPEAHPGHLLVRDKVPNNTVLERAGITSMYTELNATALSEPRLPFRGRSYPKGLSPWKIDNWTAADWETPATLQGICKRDRKALAIDTDT